jgi:starch synthase/alpha-amylase
MDVDRNSGNGFLFEVFDAPGLLWAIDQAMNFYSLPSETKAQQIARVMRASAAEFTYDRTARAYRNLYEKMLNRPLIPKSNSVPAASKSPAEHPAANPASRQTSSRP